MLRSSNCILTQAFTPSFLMVKDYQRHFKVARRHGHSNASVSIYQHFLARLVYNSCDGAVVCVVPTSSSVRECQRLTDEQMQKHADNFKTFDDFVHYGLVEYLDANEENHRNIAVYESNIKAETICLEIEPLRGGCAGSPILIIIRALRNTSQCSTYVEYKEVFLLVSRQEGRALDDGLCHGSNPIGQHFRQTISTWCKGISLAICQFKTIPMKNKP